MRLLLFFPILLILNSCTLSIGTNSHDRLQADDSKHFIPYASGINNFSKNDLNNLMIYEINGLELKDQTKKHKYTWIHLWRPYCTAEACENINGPLNIATKNNIGYLLVATSYDLKNIKESIERTAYEKAICVLQNSYFKKADKFNGKEKSLTQLSKEISNNPKLKLRNADDYFFKDTLLIYTGSPIDKTLLDERKVDSLMKIYK